jgi:hypothetical protein
MEGEDSKHGDVLSAYAPPLLGADDSPAARVLSLLNETERAVFQKRAIENGTWEETAAAAGKPLNAVGTIFARVVARITRLSGAPPPMDDDLVPVFSRAAVDPLKPEGRSISLQLDGSFYTITPELQKVGLTTSYDARMVVLWDTAASAAPPGEALRRHLDQCHYCTDLLRAMLLMQQALAAPPGSEFHLCPGSFMLANAPDMVRDAFDQHLAQCPTCREERTRALDGLAPRQTQDGAVQQSNAGMGKKIAWVAAVLLILGAGSFAGYRYFNSGNSGPYVPPAATSEPSTPTVSLEPRYKPLVQDVPLDDSRILASVLPENRRLIKYSLDQFSLGQVSESLQVSSQLAEKTKDPGAQMLYAMSLYKTLLMTDGYREMLKSEAMSPRESFRCWVMLQFALMVGDRKVLEREVEHLSSDAKYKEPAKKIMARVLELDKK